MHDVLKEKDEALPEISAQVIVKSVINRERKRAYREIYDVLMRHCREFKLDEMLEREQKTIVDSMNTVKRQFLALKGEEIYLDLVTGRVNLAGLRDTSVHFANAERFISVQKFMAKVHDLLGAINDSIKKIVRFKEAEQDHFHKKLGSSITEAVKELLKKEQEMDKMGHMHGMLDEQFK